jgi:curved DNA-binding protein CbpA
MPGDAGSSPYELLGVTPDASQLELARAYRRRARELHPDVAAGADDESFTAVTRAYRLVRDPARRAAYDAHHDPNDSAPNAISIPVRHVAQPIPLRPLSTHPPRPPIMAGPTYVSPNPEAAR